MKRLDFGSYSSTEWEEFKRIHREMFWEDVHEAAFREARQLLQEQVYKEFEEQIGAERYERTAGRRGERNGEAREATGRPAPAANGRCSPLSAVNVARKLRYHSSHGVVDRFIAVTATIKPGKADNHITVF